LPKGEEDDKLDSEKLVEIEKSKPSQWMKTAQEAQS